MSPFGKRKWWKLLAFAATGLLLVGLAACGGDDEEEGGEAGGAGEPGFHTVTIEPGQPIKIGISSVLSGDLESLGLPIAQAAELTGKDVEIEGFTIEFVRRDD